VSVTVLTASLPERRGLFKDLAASMAGQTLPPVRWLVEWDYAKDGPVAVYNRLAAQVQTEWLFRIDDDDILELDHFDTLKPYMTDDVDIVYSWCRVDGIRVHGNAFAVEFDGERLAKENHIPATALIRTDLWRKLGGYRNPGWTPHEDWDFWRRAYEAGARFRCVPIVTWTYRMSETWTHRSI